jgi:hypothetical protein
MPQFTKAQIVKFLGDHGYTSNPDGLIHFFHTDYVAVSDTEQYLDISPEAVRKGDVKPERPLRLTFHKHAVGPNAIWELESLVELPPGIESAHGDRDPLLPKVSPWPARGAI